MLEQNKLNADTRCKGSRALRPYTPELACCRVLRELRYKQSDADVPGLNEVADPWVGRLLSFGDRSKLSDRK